MQELPYDVWRLIASYIPQRHRYALGPVNRAFLHAALSNRYENMLWLDNYESEDYIKRLQDPYIARYVRCLRTNKLLKAVIQADGCREDMKDSLFRKVLVQGIQKLRMLAKPKASEIETHNREDMLQAMIAAVENMVDVKELWICPFEVPHDRIGNLNLFFSAAREAFSDNLSNLVLLGRISHFPHFLSLLTFPNLNTLRIGFTIDPSDEDEDMTDIRGQHEATLVHSVAPAIARLQPILRSLTISSNSPGDHSSFFRALGPFHKLESFTLVFHFNIDFLSDPIAIVQLLNTSASNLKTVKFEPYPNSYLDARRLYSLNRVSRSTWLALSKQLLAHNAWLSALEELTIPALDQATTMNLIRSMPQTLANLSLVDQYVRLKDISEIIELLGVFDRLRTLRIEVETLPSSLAGLIANNLPGLQTLTIVIGSNQKWSDVLFPDIDLTQSVSKCVLVDLSIYIHEEVNENVYTRKPETYQEEYIMKNLSSFFWPGVRSFKRRGHSEQLYHVDLGRDGGGRGFNCISYQKTDPLLLE